MAFGREPLPGVLVSHSVKNRSLHTVHNYFTAEERMPVGMTLLIEIRIK